MYGMKDVRLLMRVEWFGIQRDGSMIDPPYLVSAMHMQKKQAAIEEIVPMSHKKEK